MRTGIVPQYWKTAFTPIPKKGSLSEVANYRGIAMQSTIIKLFDVLITEKIYNHVQSDCQHGFVKSRSTASNLIESTQFLHQESATLAIIRRIYCDYQWSYWNNTFIVTNAKTKNKISDKAKNRKNQQENILTSTTHALCTLDYFYRKTLKTIPAHFPLNFWITAFPNTNFYKFKKRENHRDLLPNLQKNFFQFDWYETKTNSWFTLVFSLVFHVS